MLPPAPKTAIVVVFCIVCVSFLVVAVDGKEELVHVANLDLFYREGVSEPNFSIATRSSGWSRACSSRGMPFFAASQACLMAVTPAAGPPGWATMPPPARYIRSTLLVRRYVSGACPPH